MKRWGKDDIRRESLKYCSRSDFRKNVCGCAEAAWNYGEEFYNEITSHMKKPHTIVNRKWTKNKCLEESSKYNSIKELQKGNSSLYRAIRDYGEDFKDTAFSHMPKMDRTIRWTKEAILEESKKYHNRTDFSNAGGDAYSSSKRYGVEFFEESCCHMDSVRRWNDIDCKEEFSKFNCTSALRKSPKGRGAYMYAARKGRNFLNSSSSHFTPPQYGFRPDKPAFLYYAKIIHPIFDLHKIGITNLTFEERYRKKDLRKMELVFEIPFPFGEDAEDWEREILNQYNWAKYKGADVLSGARNNEIFTFDIFGID